MFEQISLIYNSISNIFLQNPVGQSIGLLAFFVSIINFIWGKDRLFIWGTLIASIFWGIHFHFIGALTAAYINYFDVAKNGVALKYERNRKWMYIFFVIYSLIGILTFFSFDIISFQFGEINYFSIFPTFCALFSTFLVFNTRGIKMKAGFLFVVFSWLIYNFTYGSIGGVLTDLSLFIAGIVGIYKDLRDLRKKELQTL